MPLEGYGLWQEFGRINRRIRMAKKKTARRKGTTRKTTRKSAAKKTTARRGRPTGARGAGAKVLERYKEEGAQVVSLRQKGMDWPEVAEKAGVSVGKAKRLHLRSTMTKAQRIEGSDTEMGKTIVHLRDQENVPWSEIEVRSAQSAPHIRELYEKSSGKSWRNSGRATTTREARPKKAAGKKAAGKKTASRKEPKRKLGKKGRSSILSKVHAKGTPDATVAELLDQRTLTIERSIDGRKMKPEVVKVATVKKVGAAKSGGKAISFVDEDQKNRIINLRDIAGVK
jgi:hypothetical protein